MTAAEIAAAPGNRVIADFGALGQVAVTLTD